MTAIPSTNRHYAQHRTAVMHSICISVPEVNPLLALLGLFLFVSLLAWARLVNHRSRSLGGSSQPRQAHISRDSTPLLPERHEKSSPRTALTLSQSPIIFAHPFVRAKSPRPVFPWRRQSTISIPSPRHMSTTSLEEVKGSTYTESSEDTLGVEQAAMSRVGDDSVLVGIGRQFSISLATQQHE
jgi:hypothetical protein